MLAQPNVTVLITWDEGVEGQGEHITTLLAGAGVTPGSTDGTLYDHYSLEAGLYKYFGLGVAPGMGATATPLPIPGLGGVPSNPSNNTQPSFAFTDPEASTSFQCRIDNAPFAACTSPYQAPVLSDGSHTFSVRAVDSAGNLGAASSYTWTVNTTPSAAPTIDTKPSDPSNTAQPSLAFSDSDSTVSFQCSLDGGGFSACTSPFATGPLTDGSHTFGVRSVNSLGTASAATTYTWTVDTTPPPAPSLTSTPPANDTNNSASFSFGDSETGVTFECQLDAGSFSTCTSPASYPGLADGSHTFTVRARDAASNPSSATSYTWTVNTTPSAAPTIDTKPSDPSNNAQPSLGFSDSDSTVSFQCSMDGAAYSACTSPFTTAALADGSHTFAVRSVNTFGNISAPTTYTWTVDTTSPPAPTLTSTPPANDTSTSASFSFGDDETGVSFECQLDAGSFSTCTQPRCLLRIGRRVAHLLGARTRRRRQRQRADRLHLVAAGTATAGAVDRHQAVRSEQQRAALAGLLRRRQHGQLPVQHGRRRLQRLHQPVHDRRAGRRLTHVRSRGRQHLQRRQRPHAVQLDGRHERRRRRRH